MEHALDPVYAAKCGVNVDELLISQPDTGEQALEITETLVRSGAVDIVVVDSPSLHSFPALKLKATWATPTMGTQAPPDVSGHAQALRGRSTRPARLLSSPTNSAKRSA